MENKFIVEGEYVDQRLDLFLVTHLKQVRNQVQRLIKERFVTVNGKSPSVHQWLREGDEIVVLERPKIEPPMPTLNIVAETPDYVVLNKQVGVLVHPALNSPFPRLTDALLVRYPDLATVGEADRPGIVHRLDRDVSGLLVVAKNKPMYDTLKKQFQERQVKKVYVGLVEGVMEDEAGVIDFPISRSKTFRGRMAARPTGEEGKAAETHYDVLERFSHMTLLKLQPVTGRMHQLRVHCKASGHPLVGDKLYGRREQGLPAAQPIERIFLQASTLSFVDLAGERQEFNLELEPELQEFLKTIRHEKVV